MPPPLSGVGAEGQVKLAHYQVTRRGAGCADVRHPWSRGGRWANRPERSRLPNRTAWAATPTFPVPVAMRPYGRAGAPPHQTGFEGAPPYGAKIAQPLRTLWHINGFCCSRWLVARAVTEEQRSAFKLGTNPTAVRPISSVIVRSQPPGSGTPLLLEPRRDCATSRGRPAFPQAASGLRLSRELSGTARAQRGDATTLWNIP